MEDNIEGSKQPLRSPDVSFLTPLLLPFLLGIIYPTQSGRNLYYIYSSLLISHSPDHTTCTEQLWSHCRRPVGLGAGMLSQFLLLPLLGFGITRTFGLSAAHSTGVLVISSSPGGVLSNTFAYFCDGDLALSVAMTTASTLLALGFIPLNIWLYGRGLETASLVIPYGKIATSLVYVTAPVALGVLIKLRLPRVANVITKVGSWSGFGMVALCIVLEFFLFPDMFSGAPWQLYVGVVLLPASGLAVGYLLARVCRQTAPACRTVAIECGVQNVPLALTVVSLSFAAKSENGVGLVASRTTADGDARSNTSR
ncbi:hypothetical protein LAZ67_22000290 [Cordylochernes scorpioides]|uniref:Uncharacterized protein n=1 Tax=Cordylochernes scorpioides TaxID=51811 RepID=A0ABY6LQN6_9ARAC|nr:hypothetical protein LAZ67_22000290 [Cordylochernes scorpioides]